MSSTVATSISGTVVGRRFQLETLAGRGGMGSVWRAHDHVTGQAVAVKLMRGDDHGDRFLREAMVLAELSHPHVVRYVEHGVTDGGDPFLAMEWLDGVDLARKLTGGPLPIAEALQIARTAAEALGVAHARGVIHRDIKPGNLFLQGGEIAALKVLDFGIARLQLASHAMTRTGMTLGTPGYMAPEQARGERDVDARADVFALGCVLFECLTGRPPFLGEHMIGVLAKVLFEDAPRVRELRPEVSPHLDTLVARMLSKRPGDRPADAEAVIAALAAVGDGTEQPRASGPMPVALTAGEQRLLSVVLSGREPTDELPAVDPVDATAATADIMTQFDPTGALAAFGATVERLADGSVIAIIAGQGAATDQAATAARCALAMRRLRPQVPMALATGRGAVTGRLPVGDVIDRAVRLLGRTLAGDAADAAVRLDETTAGLLDVRFDVGGDDRGLTLRGEREVIEATRTLLGKPTPCVGRERELALLDGVFAECVENPSAHAVLITAPAGAGKSRLAWEFLRRRKAEGRGQGRSIPPNDVEVWTGRGDPCSAGSSFAILAQALRRTAGILDGEPLAVRLKKLRARVALHVPAGDRQRVSEFLGELIGCEAIDASEMLRAARQSSSLMHDQMRRAWEDFVAAECGARPVVIVLEDLQWGDPATIKFTTAALRRAAELPLLVVAIARPEVTTLFPGLFAGKQSTHLQLGDLTARAGEKLIRAVLGDVDKAVVTRLVERAGGNAFYLEELIRAVADGKGDALPETVLAMLQARIDALDAPARRVLRAASVFGQHFWAGGVEVLLGDHAGEGLAALDELTERELIEPRGEGRFPGQPEYAFRHAIVRDAAYSLLTDADRVLGHRLAGEWLERHGEHDAIALADHFAAGDDRARAATWYAAAAEEALAANDFEAAVARAERGVACGAEGGLRGRLRGVQLEAELWRGNLTTAASRGDEALQLLAPGAPAWFDAVGVMARVCASSGRPAVVSELAEALLARGLDARDDHAVLAWVKVAMRLAFLCEYALEDRLLAPLGAITRDPTANENVRAAVLEVFAHRRQVDGDLDAALVLTLQAVDAYRKAGNMRDAYYAQIGVAIVQNELGGFADAEATLRELTRAADAAAIPTVSTVCKHNLGLTLAYLGKFDEAEAVERDAVAELEAAGDLRIGTAAKGYLMRILVAAGRPDDAVEVGRSSTQPGHTDHDLLWSASFAHALLATGRGAEALPHALAAARRLHEIGTIEEGEAVIRLVHVEALFAAGQEPEARKALAEAYDRVLHRASRIADAAWRASFLDNIPENARLVALARVHL